MASKLRFFDPHFHVWDMTPSGEGGTLSGHDENILFSPNGSPLYGKVEYEAEIGASENVVHEGGVYIEANSVCFVDTAGEELLAKYQKELNWTLHVLGKHDESKSYMYQACAALEAPNSKEWLTMLSKIPEVCGIRQIINYKPSWPRNDRLGELLANEEWRKGYKMLGEFGLAFDMQLNPSQFETAFQLIQETPNVPVIINHAGAPTLEDLTDEKKKRIYWDGLAQLAKCEHVSIKISMLCRIDPKEWDKNPVVGHAVDEIIKLFGYNRVAFASNAPVDANDAWPASRVLAAFESMTASYSTEERSWLFADAAKRMYTRVDRSC